MDRFRRLLVLLPATALALGAQFAAPPHPSLASPPIQIIADLGGCIRGSRPQFADLDVTWTDAKGHTKSHFVTSASEGGWFAPIGVCLHHVVAFGDVIQVHETSPDDVTHQFRIAKVTGTFDRATNIVEGRAPVTGTVGMAVGRPDLAVGSIPKTCVFDPTRDSAGNVHVDTTACAPGFDAIGGDVALFFWANSVSDAVRAFIRAPYVEALVGTAQADGYLDEGTSLPLTLLSSSRAVRGSAIARASAFSGAFTATFERNGHPVTIHAGDVIHGSWAGVRNDEVKPMSIDTLSSPDTVNAICSPNTSYGLSVTRAGKIRLSESGVTDGSGNATPLDVSSEPLTAGDVITFTCMRPNGDRTRLVRTVA